MLSRKPTNEGRLEKGLWATETFIADGDDLPIRQFIALLQRGRRGSCCHLVLKVQSHIAQLFLDVTDNLTFSCGGEKNLAISQRKKSSQNERKGWKGEGTDKHSKEERMQAAGA